MDSIAQRIADGLADYLTRPPIIYVTQTGDTLLSVITKAYTVFTSGLLTEIALLNKVRAVKDMLLPVGITLILPRGLTQEQETSNQPIEIEHPVYAIWAGLAREMVVAANSFNSVSLATGQSVLLAGANWLDFQLAIHTTLDYKLYLSPLTNLLRHAASYLYLRSIYTLGTGDITLTPESTNLLPILGTGSDDLTTTRLLRGITLGTST